MKAGAFFASALHSSSVLNPFALENAAVRADVMRDQFYLDFEWEVPKMHNDLLTKAIAVGMQAPRDQAFFDIFSALLMERIVFVTGEVEDHMAATISAQLLYLESSNPKKDIWMYINSPGGAVTAGMAIHDTMQYIRPRVGTVCIGQAASMGSFLLAAGEPGMRVALTNSRIMVHQPSGGARGMASDIEIQAKEILRIRKRMNDLYAKYTGKPLKDIEKAMDRDTFLEADEAKNFGLVDEVFDKRPTTNDKAE